MPIRVVGGIRLNVEEYGSGEPVLLVTGSGASGRVWKASGACPHRVPGDHAGQSRDPALG
jgi:hypothetical protein